jgi:hypothetical protein
MDWIDRDKEQQHSDGSHGFTRIREAALLTDWAAPLLL